MGTGTLTIIHGTPLTERKSTFQAHLARVSTPGQVAEVVAKLLENNKVDRPQIKGWTGLDKKGILRTIAKRAILLCILKERERERLRKKKRNREILQLPCIRHR